MTKASFVMIRVLTCSDSDDIAEAIADGAGEPVECQAALLPVHDVKDVTQVTKGHLETVLDGRDDVDPKIWNDAWSRIEMKHGSLYFVPMDLVELLDRLNNP